MTKLLITWTVALLIGLGYGSLAVPCCGDKEPPKKKLGVALPVGTVLTPESIAKDLIGKETTLADGSKIEFSDRKPEYTKIKSIKKITIVTDIVRIDVEIDAHLC